MYLDAMRIPLPPQCDPATRATGTIGLHGTPPTGTIRSQGTPPTGTIDFHGFGCSGSVPETRGKVRYGSDDLPDLTAPHSAEEASSSTSTSNVSTAPELRAARSASGSTAPASTPAPLTVVVSDAVMVPGAVGRRR